VMSFVSDSSTEKNWFGHPRGLTVLFLTEMWEMFSFFGMRAILVYYMTKHLDMSQEYASLVYGAYAAFIYFTPVFGGMIADRWLGKARAVVIGGSLMALGHFMMSFESLFYPALCMIALGNGLFLPSLASQIEGLYRHGDTRAKSAYNIYYVGINLGAFMAPFICGTLGEVYGWHYGFAAAGIGMLLSLVIYLAGRRYLPPEPARGAETRAARPPMDKAARDRFVLLFGIAAIVVLFRGAYEQVGNTIALWADTGIDRHLTSGWSIPMTWFITIDSLVVFAFTPILVARWARLAKRGIETPLLARMAFGAAIVGASYVALGVVAAWSEARGVRFCHWRVIHSADRIGAVRTLGAGRFPCHQHCDVVFCRLLRQPAGGWSGHLVECAGSWLVLRYDRRCFRRFWPASVFAEPPSGRC
jgi:POT family proton-dependent oligopeptide transporter